MKYDEDIRDDSSSADQSAKVWKGVAEVQGLPHGHTNLGIGFFVEDEKFDDGEGKELSNWAQHNTE